MPGLIAMRRRHFLFAGVMLASFARYAIAQQSVPKKRIAVVTASTKLENMKGDPNLEAFFDELKRHGFVEGENLIVDRYSGEGRLEKYDIVAREVVNTNPDLIFTGGTPLTRRFKAATSTIPVVTVTGDPIRFGIVSSLAHPGGNITGVSVDAGIEIWGKRLELLAEAVPKLNRVVFISTRGAWDAPGGQAVREAAQKLKISLTSAPLDSPFDEAELRRVFNAMPTDHIDGIAIAEEGEIYPYRFLLVELVQQIRVPAIYTLRDQAEAGGLMSYSWDFKATMRRNAMQVAEILRGANPGDMPYFQESHFELVINRKTAQTLGLEIPDGLIASADEVID